GPDRTDRARRQLGGDPGRRGPPAAPGPLARTRGHGLRSGGGRADDLAERQLPVRGHRRAHHGAERGRAGAGGLVGAGRAGPGERGMSESGTGTETGARPADPAAVPPPLPASAPAPPLLPAPGAGPEGPLSP